MATITEDYVSFETAMLLKDNGFNEVCRYYYSDSHTQLISYYNCKQSDMFGPEACIAPTQSMAMKWLREVHNLFIFPFPQRNTDSFWVEIYSIDKDKNEKDKWENLYCETIDLKNFSTYEEAVEAGIKYCLENLI